MAVEKVRVRDFRDVAERLVSSGRVAPEDIAAAAHEMLSEVRAYRLAEIRKQQGRTQAELADELAVAQSRISAIENGELMRTELGTISAYVEALGGKLRVVADFGDQLITVE
jgi:DNA-binding XRE family transcriptional regulator